MIGIFRDDMLDGKCLSESFFLVILGVKRFGRNVGKIQRKHWGYVGHGESLEIGFVSKQLVS